MGLVSKCIWVRFLGRENRWWCQKYKVSKVYPYCNITSTNKYIILQSSFNFLKSPLIFEAGFITPRMYLGSQFIYSEIYKFTTNFLLVPYAWTRCQLVWYAT